MARFRFQPSDESLPHSKQERRQKRIAKQMSRMTVTSSSGSSTLAVPEPIIEKSRRGDIYSRKGDNPSRGGDSIPRKAANKRKRSGLNPEKRHDINMAIKKETLRLSLKHRPYPFVYVGNVEPTVCNEDLQSFFEVCGPIHHIQIRCSWGAAVVAGTSYPGRRSTDRQYATVEFKRPSGVIQALRLNGKDLHGVPLVVSHSPADLPEVKYMVRAKTPQAQKPKSIPRLQSRPNTPSWFSFFRTTGSAPLLSQGTERTIDGDTEPEPSPSPPPKPRNNLFFGISFPKTLM